LLLDHQSSHRDASASVADHCKSNFQANGEKKYGLPLVPGMRRFAAQQRATIEIRAGTITAPPSISAGRPASHPACEPFMAFRG
jgi:hypothetical protein